MRSYKRSRRSRSARRGRSGGADDMNINVPNEAQPMNIYDDDNMPPAPPLVHAASNPPPAPQLIREVVNQNVHMQPNQPAQGALGLVFAPPPGVQLPGAQHNPPHNPHNPQGPIGGRKSRRRKSHRRKSHRRKSHRR